MGKASRVLRDEEDVSRQREGREDRVLTLQAGRPRDKFRSRAT